MSEKIFEVKRHYPDGYGNPGRDWMTHELEFRVLIQAKNNYERIVYSKMWRSAILNCQVYLTQQKKFSLGFDALVKWMHTSFVRSHSTKEAVLGEIEITHKSDWKNYIPFELWYNKISKEKCFYEGDPRYHENYFPLSMTDAMLNNIHKKLFTPPNTVWIDQINWRLTDISDNKKIAAKKRSVQNELPSEVWTS